MQATSEVKVHLDEVDKCGEDLQVALDGLNALATLAPKIEELSSVVSYAAFFTTMGGALGSGSSTIRRAALRTLRRFMRDGDSDFVRHLVFYQVAYFISRSLEKDKGTTAERVEAMRVVRRLVEIDPVLTPRCIIQSLLAIVETRDDSFVRIALDTLALLAVQNIKGVAQCGGMRTLLNALVDPTFSDQHDSLLAGVLYILNHPQNRAYLRPHTDLRGVFAALTEGPGLAKSWTGLIYLSSDPSGMRSLVLSLTLPFPELHELVLDGIMAMFHLPAAAGKEAFARRASTEAGRTSGPSDHLGLGVGLDLPSRTFSDRPNLLYNYLGMVLVILVDCGLIQALVKLGQDKDDLPNFTPPVFSKGEEREGGEKEKEDKDKEKVSREKSSSSPPPPERQVHNAEIATKATVLLAELLHLSHFLLPTSQCARLQTLPELMCSAVSFNLTRGVRMSASAMVGNLHQFSHIKGESSFFDFHLSLIVTGANKWRRLKGRNRRLDRIDDVKKKIDWGMDDKQLLARLQQTQILATKDYSRWEWYTVTEILEGPLRNPTHLSTALQTKFIKRILSFLRPSNLLFSAQSWTVPNMKYVRVACLLLEVLLAESEGYKYLEEKNPLVFQIADLLRVEVEGVPDKNGPRLLSPERVLKTMAREYFTMLGTLSSTERGLELMKKFKIFNYLKSMTELQGRDDLSFLILTSLDYNISGGHSRVILSKALTSQSKVVRFLATRHMRVLLRAGVANFSAWGIEFLVIGMSLSVLDEAVDEEECLDCLISKQPASVLAAIGRPGRDLLLRLLSTEAGLEYLSRENDFISGALQYWKETGNLEYVTALDDALSEAFSAPGSEYLTKHVIIPPHLYGELAKTAKGCGILKQSAHHLELLAVLRDVSQPPLARRTAMWALGHIASSEFGLKLLDESWANSGPGPALGGQLSSSGSWMVGSPRHPTSTHKRTPSSASSSPRSIASATQGSSATTPRLRSGSFGSPPAQKSPLRRSLLSTPEPSPALADFKDPREALREAENVVEALVRIAETDGCFAVRGTAVYVIGMVSGTEQGRQRLERFGWDTPCHVNSHVSLPRDIRSTPFLRIDENEYIDVFVAPESETGEAQGKESIREEIILWVTNLSNHITAERAMNALKRAKVKHPSEFRKAALAKEILQMLERYRFRLPVRRFVYSLLDDSAFDRSFFAALANVRPVARKGTWTLAVPGHPGKP
ncbi:cytosolic regulator of adenylate cyclase [Acanthamoeba castellanii str. Neff]|uniref:Cytosolic regulator of adenylate cyclase n=1 Tax=Acanthamoeba castellanii (strain ATCC 30010 / Neff) TaxID=1257118 RepID=L8HKF1_ACACF|nr:cytosolic regulator of adenylate cyclase [Acanthamoeba castellanii str. Neff]ELR24886.1 cytosolic regulator of adenylate cyclase [Acanthamoeba castellanii str. Neff]